MKKKFAYKQYFVEEKYPFLRAILRYSIQEGKSLRDIAEGSGVHLWTLRRFYYGDNSALPVKSFLSLLGQYGYSLELRIVEKKE